MQPEFAPYRTLTSGIEQALAAGSPVGISYATPPSNLRRYTERRVTASKMWVIEGPEGMQMREAKKILGVVVGPQDVVAYRQRSTKGLVPMQPRIISVHQIPQASA